MAKQNSRSSSSHRDQLKAIIPALLHSNIPMNAGQWRRDGEDHINISRRGETQIGTRLDLDHPKMFDHPILGHFKSINALWYFLRARNSCDQLRGMIGGELKAYVYKECGGLRGHVPNFRAVIMHSAYLRLKGFKDYAKQVADSTLPFDCYRSLDSGIRERLEYTPWVTGGYEEIRLALRENVEPDFSYLMDEPGSTDIYAGVIRMLNPHHGEQPKARPAPVAKKETPVVATDTVLNDRPPRKTKAERRAEWEVREANRAAKAALTAPIVAAAPTADLIHNPEVGSYVSKVIGIDFPGTTVGGVMTSNEGSMLSVEVSRDRPSVETYVLGAPAEGRTLTVTENELIERSQTGTFVSERVAATAAVLKISPETMVGEITTSTDTGRSTLSVTLPPLNEVGMSVETLDISPNLATDDESAGVVDEAIANDGDIIARRGNSVLIKGNLGDGSSNSTTSVSPPMTDEEAARIMSLLGEQEVYVHSTPAAGVATPL